MSATISPALAAISQAFVSARREARALPAFPGEIPPTLTQVYALQDHSIRAWPDRVAGWKIGLIPPPLRAAHDGEERLIGPVFARKVQYAGAAPVRFEGYAGGFAAVEAEFIVRIARDVAPGAAPADPLELVGALHFGMEPASSPLSTINELGPRVVVSDFGNNNGLIIGPEIAGWRERAPESLQVRTVIEGELIGSASLANLPGGLAGALRFLLDKLASRGLYLRAGDWITTGAITGVHRVEPGTRASVELLGLPPIDLLAVPAQPLE